MKGVLFSICCFLATNGHSQESNGLQPYEGQLNLNPTGKPGVQVRTDERRINKDTASVPNRNFALIGSGRVRTLAQDNMPCIVPDLSNVPPIPNAFARPKVSPPQDKNKTFRPPLPNAIPNPAPPIQFRKYKP